MKRYGILDRVKSSSDLRDLSYVSLDELCGALREFIIDHVSKTGGHLASNLGIVELAVALEREFDSEKDRIIYDVGHQCYVHKILTGRKNGFDHLREFGGISGFLRPEESNADPASVDMLPIPFPSHLVWRMHVQFAAINITWFQ